MRKTHPATIARPVVVTQICNCVAVFCVEIIDKQFLNPSSKCFNSNLANVDDNVILVIVLGSARKVLDMLIFVGSNTCRARHQIFCTITTNNAVYQFCAEGKRWR